MPRNSQAEGLEQKPESQSIPKYGVFLFLSQEIILVSELAFLQTQRTVIQVKCPACGKKETIMVTEVELEYAKMKHALITKAVAHTKDGHVLTLYIDGQGIVRRKYCFDIAKKKLNHFTNILPENLDSIFEQMIQDAMKTNSAMMDVKE